MNTLINTIKGTTWITGPGGCGKTYNFIKNAQKNGGRFAAVSGTRLSAIEMFDKYATSRDQIHCGTVKIVGNEKGNHFGTYSTIVDSWRNFDTIAFDEVHNIDGPFRSARDDIRAVMRQAVAAGKRVVCLTATNPFVRVEGVHYQEMQPLNPVERELVCQAQTRRRIGKVQTLIICSQWKQVNYWKNWLEENQEEGSFAIADRRESEFNIYKRLLDFNEGKIKTLVTSNIGQESINPLCQNLHLELTERYDTPTTTAQKIYRLGRFGTASGKFTYSFDYHPMPRRNDDEDDFWEDEDEDDEDDEPPHAWLFKELELKSEFKYEDGEGYEDEPPQEYIDEKLTDFLCMRKAIKNNLFK